MPLKEEANGAIEITPDVQEAVNQLTQHKLEFVHKLLTGKGIRGIGNLNRDRLRGQLELAIQGGLVSGNEVMGLLDELDHWGDQRILIRKFPAAIVRPLLDDEELNRRLEAAELNQHVNGHIDLRPPLEMTPMNIAVTRLGNTVVLRLVAAKTREIWVHQEEIPDIEGLPDYPDIIFRPFKKEIQKAVAFAEVNLRTGLTLISATTLRQGQAYKAEFQEFYDLFDALLPFDQMTSVELYQANSAIYGLPLAEIRLVAQKRRTTIGHHIDYTSNSSRFDFRADAEIAASRNVLPNPQNNFCNGFWQPVDGLDEQLHSHIYTPEGQLTILGKVREQSVRYVLRRILDLN